MTGVLDSVASRSLLAEMIRRAAYDWVLYRSHRRLKQRQVARDAYVWLFEEGPGHDDWMERQRDGWHGFSFLAICDALELDPVSLRGGIKKLRVKDVLAAGRPPVHRRPPADREVEDAASPDIGARNSHLLEIREIDIDDVFSQGL